MEFIIVGVLGFALGGAIFGTLGANNAKNIREQFADYAETAASEFDRMYDELLTWKAKAQKKKLPN